ncbi:hypothetical protein PHSY_006536 [Pseudozyma hubeiensis SY62]|uniref:Uncharacterized protein n=1 Tax=Pseudozyma hubeiensis (strain SY62) TaxID=1305764 RepID=R9PC68_PSEHS|nr:hypothetical protein PHSY_006536 [Pseudozyma hubeiensis SY62]GAC98939.1 hypothetical protein PHSY_006536 [Pseudozyma hubeiensis SY62]
MMIKMCDRILLTISRFTRCIACRFVQHIFVAQFLNDFLTAASLFTSLLFVTRQSTGEIKCCGERLALSIVPKIIVGIIAKLNHRK